MFRILTLLTVLFGLTGCGMDSSFERGYIISQSENGQDVDCSTEVEMDDNK